MTRVVFTGERLREGDAHFGVDLARHQAAYELARRHAGGARVLDLQQVGRPARLEVASAVYRGSPGRPGYPSSSRFDSSGVIAVQAAAPITHHPTAPGTRFTAAPA